MHIVDISGQQSEQNIMPGGEYNWVLKMDAILTSHGLAWDSAVLPHVVPSTDFPEIWLHSKLYRTDSSEFGSDLMQIGLNQVQTRSRFVQIALDQFSH